MKNDVTVRTKGGIGFCGLLTIALILLKLMNLITLPWIWVLFGPLLAVTALTIAIFLIYFIIVGIIALIGR